MAITNVALSLFHYTRELKKRHHLVVIERQYVNKLVGGMVNLAQTHERISKCLQYTHWPLFPTTIDDIFAKSWQMHCGLPTTDMR